MGVPGGTCAQVHKEPKYCTVNETQPMLDFFLEHRMPINSMCTDPPCLLWLCLLLLPRHSVSGPAWLRALLSRHLPPFDFCAVWCGILCLMHADHDPALYYLYPACFLCGSAFCGSAFSCASAFCV